MKDPGDNNENVALEAIKNKINEISLNMEKLGIAEYVDLLHNPRRLFFINFWGGVARGFGMAVGFTLLAALVLYLLRHIIQLNLPIIGQFIADLVDIVQNELRIK